MTNLLITFGSENEEAVLKQLGEYKHRGLSFHIVSVKDKSLPQGWYGGSKNLECSVLLGAYNHLHLKSLVEFMRGMVWEAPEDVQLIIRKQWESKFRIIDLFPEEQ
ncbi:hypothetical protein [Hymenobacter swuensis]|uniref:hypothetical protein n=1 Tax=Hymenobacter swuensis TaxID=1446467 RepID=UPI0012DDF6D4|nr:hypothetical protein [Hymenobacter swuensis]